MSSTTKQMYSITSSEASTSPRNSTSSNTAPPPYEENKQFYGTSNDSKKSIRSVFSKKSSEIKSGQVKTVQKNKAHVNKEPFYAALVAHSLSR